MQVITEKNQKNQQETKEKKKRQYIKKNDQGDNDAKEKA